MERTIPSAILVKGISKEGLTNLLNDIEYAVIDEGIDVINEDAEKIISIIRENKPGEETEDWVKRFKEQNEVLEKVADKNVNKIEMLFERIFKDWEEYQKTNISVINLEEIASTVMNEEEVPENKEDNNDENIVNEDGVEEEAVEENSLDLDSNNETEKVDMDLDEKDEEESSVDIGTNANENEIELENPADPENVEEDDIELEIDIPVDHIEEDVESDIDEETKTEGENHE